MDGNDRAAGETDPDGRVAVRYAIAYIATEDERVLLDAVGPHSPLPLFAVERRRWAGEVGNFGFFGDGAGLFHYVMLPAGTYNTLRDLALDGRPPFAALILRDPPVADVDNGDGSLDYQWLADRGFRMTDDEPRRERSFPDDASVRTEPLIDLLIALLVSRDFRDAVDDGLGDLTRAGREGTNTVTVVLDSTDGSHAGMTRAWGATHPGEPGAGTPLVLRDIEVISQMEVGIQRARTNSLGVAIAEIAVGAAVSICIRANNFAVQVDEGFEATQACDFRRLDDGVTIANAVDGAEVTLRVTDPVWNIVAQFTDGNDYSRRVMGHTVSHRAGVLIGAYADLFGAFQNNRAFALCGGYMSLINFRWFHIGGLLNLALGDPFGFVTGKILSHDVIFPNHGEDRTPDRGAWSRVTPTHEYGHFLQCDMMSVLGGDGDFTEGWGDVIDTSLFGGPRGPETQNLVLTEAIADYFAAQITGGLRQFRLAEDSGFDDNESFYCDPTLSTCLEDNVGGLNQVVPADRLPRRPGDLFPAVAARATTLLVDAVDGPRRVLPDGVLDQPSASAFWARAPDDTLVPSMAIPATDAMDEQVTLSGAMMPDTFREMSTMGNTLNQRNFFGALARVARRSFTDAQVCDMFALHSPDELCTTLADEDDLMATPITPSAPLITSGVVDMRNNARWTWTDVSSAATEYSLELLREDAVRLRTTRPYRRMDSFSSAPGLDFDTQFTFRVATVNVAEGGRPRATSPFSEHTIHTFAESVRSADALPLPGAAHLSWDPVQATEVCIHDVTGGIDVVVACTSETEVIIPGLAGGVERTYTVVAQNALGVASAPSAPVSVTPLDPVTMFAADFGDDAHPEAGSAAHPFRTLRAAMARAVAIDADEIILHEGAFTEAGPFTIAGSIAIRGGFRLSAGTWTDVGGETRVTVTGGTRVAGCATDTFNAASRATSAAIALTPGASATILDVDLVGVRGSVPGSECFAAIHSASAVLTIDGGSISGSGTTGACVAAIVADGPGLVTVTGSTVAGATYAGTSIPTGIDAAGIALCDGASLMAELSEVAAIAAPSLLVSSSVGAVVGVTGDDTGPIRVQRSRVSAIAGTYAWHATSGRLGGIQVTATGRVLIANSIVRTPHGGTVNRAVDVGSGSSPLTSLQLYHVTAAIGEDWSLAQPVTLPFEGAVVSMSGDIRNVAIFNSLLAYAGGGVDRMGGTVFTGVDRSRTTADPLVLSFAGNVISIPGVSDWHLASLTQCIPIEEFGTVFDEATLNSPAGHECHDGARSSWLVARNAAFQGAPGSGPRAPVELLDDGYPVDGPRTFVVGEAVDGLPLAGEVATDLGSLTRGVPPGVGAWAPR